MLQQVSVFNVMGKSMGLYSEFKAYTKLIPRGPSDGMVLNPTIKLRARNGMG